MTSRGGFFAAMIAALLMLAAYYAFSQRSGGGTGDDRIQDGDGLTFSCQGGVVVSVLKATYEPALPSTGCSAADVTGFMREWAEANPNKTFQVGPSSFPGVKIPPCRETRMLVIGYACVQPGESAKTTRV